MFQDSMGDHALLPAPGPAVPSRRPKGIDRAAAARLLAEGRSIAEVARAVGCTRQNLWRQVQRSKRLARLIRSAEEEARTDAYGRLALLGPAAVETLRRALVDDDDAGVAFKIADRMNLFERPAAADPTLDLSPGQVEFTHVLADVTRRAMAASRDRHLSLMPQDYATLWDEAVRARAAKAEPVQRNARPVHSADAEPPAESAAGDDEREWDEAGADDAYDGESDARD